MKLGLKSLSKMVYYKEALKEIKDYCKRNKNEKTEKILIFIEEVLNHKIENYLL